MNKRPFLRVPCISNYCSVHQQQGGVRQYWISVTKITLPPPLQLPCMLPSRGILKWGGGSPTSRRNSTSDHPLAFSAEHSTSLIHFLIKHVFHRNLPCARHCPWGWVSVVGQTRSPFLRGCIPTGVGVVLQRAH